MRYGGATGKLVIGLILVLVVGLVAAACGGDDDEDEAAQLVPAATEAPAEEAASEEIAVAEPAATEPEEEVAMVAARGTFRDYHQSFLGWERSHRPRVAVFGGTLMY